MPAMGITIVMTKVIVVDVVIEMEKLLWLIEDFLRPPLQKGGRTFTRSLFVLES